MQHSVFCSDIRFRIIYGLQVARLLMADINTFPPEEAAAHRDQAGAAAARWRGPEL